MQKCWKGQVAVGTLEIWRCNRPFPSLQGLMVSAMSRPRAREDTTVMMSPSSASIVVQVLFLCPHSPLYKHAGMPTLLLEEPSNVKNSSRATGVSKTSLPPELWESSFPIRHQKERLFSRWFALLTLHWLLHLDSTTRQLIHNQKNVKDTELSSHSILIFICLQLSNS